MWRQKPYDTLDGRASAWNKRRVGWRTYSEGRFVGVRDIHGTIHGMNTLALLQSIFLVRLHVL